MSELINNKPIGLISKTMDKSYGFNGSSYYVTIGVADILAFGTMKMTFEQAKCAYEAILFFNIDVYKWNYKQAKETLKNARKTKLIGDDLMFYFGKAFKAY